MPDRIIRESSLNSPSLAQLSHGAERLFWRITVVADDSGRFDANPLVLKARCFPLLVDQIKTADVAKWMSELSRECIQIYTVNGRQCGAFRNWSKYQRVYGNKSKFPDPPAECGESPQIPADSRSYPISDNRESILDTAVLEMFETQFWKPFPSRKGKKLLKDKAKERFLALSPEDQRLCCAAVKAYARYCQEANRLPKDPPRFINGQDGELWKEFIPAATKQAPERPLPVVRQPSVDPLPLQALRGPTPDEAAALAQFTQRIGQGGPSA